MIPNSTQLASSSILDTKLCFSMFFNFTIYPISEDWHISMHICLGLKKEIEWMKRAANFRWYFTPPHSGEVKLITPMRSCLPSACWTVTGPPLSPAQTPRRVPYWRGSPKVHRYPLSNGAWPAPLGQCSALLQFSYEMTLPVVCLRILLEGPSVRPIKLPHP